MNATARCCHHESYQTYLPICRTLAKDLDKSLQYRTPVICQNLDPHSFTHDRCKQMNKKHNSDTYKSYNKQIHQYIQNNIYSHKLIIQKQNECYMVMPTLSRACQPKNEIICINSN